MKTSLPVTWYPGPSIHLADPRQFVLQFQKSQGAHHFADRDLGIIGPENPAIFVFIIVEAGSWAVLLPERFSMLQVSAPWQDGIAEIEFMYPARFRVV